MVYELIDSAAGTEVVRRGPGLPPAGNGRPPRDLAPPEDAPTGCQEIKLRNREDIDSWLDSFKGKVEHAEFFKEMQDSDPKAANNFAQALATLPEVGTEFLGFRLVAELGRGGFGRVYLAEQADLANRFVALKVSACLIGESQTLARLQHTNIVPIYSMHRTGPFQAICMPYFGATTLADVLKDLGAKEGPPDSGKSLVVTLQDRKSTLRQLDPSGAVKSGTKSHHDLALDGTPEQAAGPFPASADAGATHNLQHLQQLSYVDAVLWIATRIVEGLAHAHEHGIIHRDLKPANVLLTDEGQPMLLDFNMAEDTKLRANASAALVGGTLPYMAPEQLEAYRGAPSIVEGRSDIYALGILFFELLTRRHPFPVHRGSLKTVLAAMLEDRRQTPPALRPWNRDVSPAVESIVRHCLEPDPARRYQSAADLLEDLERHQAHLPLKHAPEPSLKERAQKWLRRHPRLTSSTSVAVFGLAVVFGLVGWGLHRHQRLAELEAKASLSQFQEDMKSAQYYLMTRTADPEQLDKGTSLCERLLEPYQVLRNPAWQELPAVRSLSEADREQLREDVGELLLLWSRATALRAGPDDRLQVALRLNDLAGTCLGGAEASPAVEAQRAELAALLGREAEAKRLREAAQQIPPRSARDRYLAATEHVSQGRYRQALPLLREATRQDPQHFWSWFSLGLCHDGLSENAEAIAKYSTAIALRPNFPWSYYNRALVYYRQGAYPDARADFDQVIRMEPEFAEAYANRGLALQKLKQYDAAIADMTRALDLGAPYTRIYFMRAAVRELAGDAEGAKRDVDEGLHRQPADEQSWVARAMRRYKQDFEGALGDLDRALALNPRSQIALQNKAYLLSNRGRNEEALEVLNKQVALYPDFVLGRAGRGVLLARLHRYPEARNDAEETLRRDTSPAMLYQCAGIYALTSQENADDRLEAFRLLSSALRRGYGFNDLDADRELDPIRSLPEFTRLVAAARALRPGGEKSNH